MKILDLVSQILYFINEIKFAASILANHNYISHNKLYSKTNVATALAARGQKRTSSKKKIKIKISYGFEKYFSDDKRIKRFTFQTILYFTINLTRSSQQVFTHKFSCIQIKLKNGFVYFYAETSKELLTAAKIPILVT